jgi:hypothetical protein
LTEDSGAFKTNPVNSQQVPAFVMFPARPLPSSRTIQESFSGLSAGDLPRSFLTNAAKALRYPQAILIRYALAVPVAW